MSNDETSEIDYTLGRESAFSYQCNACARCCHDKEVHVGPYEILRLARCLRMTTTEFIAQHTEAGGTLLRTNDSNRRACIFLTYRGCGVYSDRPFVCRIYPLALYRDTYGHERYSNMIPDPKTAGIYGTSGGGTVGDFLDQHETAPFFETSKRYGALYLRMLEALEKLDPEELDRHESRRDDVNKMATGSAASPWIDIDQTVADFCKAQGRVVPDDLEGTVAVHIEAIETWIASL
jgi:uncharacterized protein